MSARPESDVSIARVATPRYPERTPFSPPRRYAELDAIGLIDAVDESNEVYAAVRHSFELLGLDAAKAGTPAWNPLGDVVRPGNAVLVKPNWVSERHHRGGSWLPLITHGSVIRPILDYVQLALKGRGEIWLADGPMLDTNFDLLVEQTGVRALGAFYEQRAGMVPVRLLDLRTLRFENRGEVVYARRPQPGDPAGSTRVDLGRRSALYAFRGEGRYYGADYDTAEVNRHHQGTTHEYLLSRTAMNADVIIDVPKLKTHAKVGMTGALKGVVGLNAGRNWLPHYTKGTPAEGGDQFGDSGARTRVERLGVRSLERLALRLPYVGPRVFRLAKALLRPLFGASEATVRGGAWHGNDTLWRMVLDINRALTYADASGVLHDASQRRRFVVMDGVIAGEGAGPVFCDAVPAGVVLAARNPVAADVVAAGIMGFDYQKIPMLREALQDHPLPLANSEPGALRVATSEHVVEGATSDTLREVALRFRPPHGWDELGGADAER